jgi:hypothetical protein
MEELKLYWKVYQNREYIENEAFYVSTTGDILMNMPDLVDECEDIGELPPVIEPVMMTETEFNNLPEFEGY